MQISKKQQQLELPQYLLTEREREFERVMLAINYLSLNTKSGYKDLRSFSFLIDKALSFAVFLILITP